MAKQTKPQPQPQPQPQATQAQQPGAAPLPAPVAQQPGAAPLPGGVQVVQPHMPSTASTPPQTAVLAVPALGAPVAVARNVAARAHTLCAALPPALQGATLRAGTPCRVRVPYTLASWQQVQAALAAAGGQASAATLATAATTDFVRYAVRRGWLVPA